VALLASLLLLLLLLSALLEALLLLLVQACFARLAHCCCCFLPAKMLSLTKLKHRFLIQSQSQIPWLQMMMTWTASALAGRCHLQLARICDLSAAAAAAPRPCMHDNSRGTYHYRVSGEAKDYCLTETQQ
jgi:hypothetical protein